MKALSVILGIFTIINTLLIFLSMSGKITREYILYGVIYSGIHLIYQYKRGEGFFSQVIKKH